MSEFAFPLLRAAEVDENCLESEAKRGAVADVVVTLALAAATVWIVRFPSGDTDADERERASWKNRVFNGWMERVGRERESMGKRGCRLWTDIIQREGEVGGAGGETGCRMKAFQWLG